MIKTIKSEIRNKAGPKTYWESIAKGKNTAKNLLASIEKNQKDTNANSRQSGMYQIANPLLRAISGFS
jgi:hypothetical protein